MTEPALPTPTLTTARLRLRPVDETDAGDLVALHTDRVVLRYWDDPPWAGPEVAADFVRRSHAVAADGTGARVVVERVDDGAFLGWCGVNGWNAQHGTARVAYIYRQEAWGHGFATEAAEALLGWAFEALPLRRVQTEVDPRNGASARVLEKLGFVREGLLREDCVVEGEVSSSWVYGLLRREWRPTAR